MYSVANVAIRKKLLWIEFVHIMTQNDSRQNTLTLDDELKLKSKCRKKGQKPQSEG